MKNTKPVLLSEATTEDLKSAIKDAANAIFWEACKGVFWVSAIVGAIEWLAGNHQ